MQARQAKTASASLSRAVKEIVHTVRPELNESQLAAAATIIARDVRPTAKTVELRDVRRTRAAVARAIGRATERSTRRHSPST